MKDSKSIPPIWQAIIPRQKYRCFHHRQHRHFPHKPLVLLSPGFTSGSTRGKPPPTNTLQSTHLVSILSSPRRFLVPVYRGKVGGSNTSKPNPTQAPAGAQENSPQRKLWSPSSQILLIRFPSPSPSGATESPNHL